MSHPGPQVGSRYAGGRTGDEDSIPSIVIVRIAMGQQNKAILLNRQEGTRDQRRPIFEVSCCNPSPIFCKVPTPLNRCSNREKSPETGLKIYIATYFVRVHSLIHGTDQYGSIRDSKNIKTRTGGLSAVPSVGEDRQTACTLVPPAIHYSLPVYEND